MAFGALDSQSGRVVMQIMSVMRLVTSLKGILEATSTAQDVHTAATVTGAGANATLTTSIIAETAAQTGSTLATTGNTVAQTGLTVTLAGETVAQTTLTAATTGSTIAQVAQNTATNQGVLSLIGSKIALVASTAAHYIHAAGAWVATTAQNALNISYATFLALTGVGIAVIVAAAAAMWYFASQMNAAASSVTNFNGAAGRLPFSGRSVQRAGEAELTRRGIE